MNKPPIKPGYRSSEFWLTAVSFIFSGLYLVGFITDNDQKEDVIRDVSHGVESVILISGQLVILWKYINSRKEIKKTWWNLPVGEETIPKTDESKSKPRRKKKNATTKNNGSIKTKTK